MKSECRSLYGEPNHAAILMAPFARKNLIQAGFIAGLHFCGVDQHELSRTDPERYKAMCKALVDSFESHGLTREIEC